MSGVDIATVRFLSVYLMTVLMRPYDLRSRRDEGHCLPLNTIDWF